MSLAETGFVYDESHMTDSYYDDLEVVSEDRSLRFAAAVGNLSCETSILAADFMGVRKDYVESRGWLPESSSDEDEYDADMGTAYILRGNLDNPIELLGGMRLTQVESPQSSMTWRMMDKNPAMRENISDEVAEKLARAEEQGAIFDLTRLVVPEDGRLERGGVRETLQETKDVVLDVFGAGIAATHEEGQETAWYFLTTQQMKSFLGNLGIKFTVLAEDEVTPGDNEKSALCVTFPGEALEALRTSNRLRDRNTYKRVSAARDAIVLD